MKSVKYDNQEGWNECKGLPYMKKVKSEKEECFIGAWKFEMRECTKR